MAMYSQNVAVLDIETNYAWDTVWMVGLYFPSTGESMHVTCPDTLTQALRDVDTIVGHNLLGFDLPVLGDVWRWHWKGDVRDTLILGRLYNPALEGGHSLRAWAERAGGELKDEFTDFDGGLTDQMVEYCLQDCRANWDVYTHITALLDAENFSDTSIEIEQDVRRYTTEQERNGFKFDFPAACTKHAEIEQRMEEITNELQKKFPPIVEERYSEKTGKRLKDKVTTFNPGSRQQVAERLTTCGATWSKHTPTGKPQVDEGTLANLSHIPEAGLVLEYLTLSKRCGMVQSWLDAYQEDGRIHGRVNTMGAITFRMSHSKPNLAQVPSEADYRKLFIADGKLVGIDASGLELRMLAHYMQDEEYTDLILHGDIHTYNQNLAGLTMRDQAKTFIYALLYGAGDAKIGSIVDGNAKDGALLRHRFLEGLPAYEKLITRIGKIAQTGSVPGLDGRRVRVRSEHAALNTLLQSAGAIVMKHALCIAVEKLATYGYPYTLVAQVHDEFQVDVPEEYAQAVGAVFRNAIREAGRRLDLRCPLDGEYRIGNNWSETH
jgi:DNA polymerase-1